MNPDQLKLAVELNDKIQQLDTEIGKLSLALQATLNGINTFSVQLIFNKAVKEKGEMYGTPLHREVSFGGQTETNHYFNHYESYGLIPQVKAPENPDKDKPTVDLIKMEDESMAMIILSQLLGAKTEYREKTISQLNNLISN